MVALVVEGLTNAEAADRLGLSVRTIQSHVANALDKTGSRSRVQLTVLALCRGLVPCPEHHESGHPAAPGAVEGETALGTSAD